MTRPSHTIPRDIFDAILDLEQAARTDAVFHVEKIARATEHTGVDVAEYLRLVATTGVKRDQLATLILKSFEEVAVRGGDPLPCGCPADTPTRQIDEHDVECLGCGLVSA